MKTQKNHANATIRHNKNSIRMLRDSEGVEKFGHEEKAEIIWEAFKNRMGTSEFSKMHFDLEDLIQHVMSLENLVIPFTKEEVDGIVKNIPSGKSPSPDGFNTDFIKKCWPIIAIGFYELCQGFMTTASVCKASATLSLLLHQRYIILLVSVIIDQFHSSTHP
jgi:hypothetical protein